MEKPEMKQTAAKWGPLPQISMRSRPGFVRAGSGMRAHGPASHGAGSQSWASPLGATGGRPSPRTTSGGHLLVLEVPSLLPSRRVTRWLAR